jgi:hypothetical protein
MESAMSNTPIFDTLLGEFTTEKRWTPMLAPSQDYYAYDLPLFGMGAYEELLDPAVEPWYPAPKAETIVQDPEDWLHRMSREIDEAMQELKPPVKFTATAADALSHLSTSSPFVDLMNQHQNEILNPETMPTRESLELESVQEEKPESEPEEEEQHVFPITRENGHTKFLKDPVAGMLERVRGLLYVNQAA